MVRLLVSTAWEAPFAAGASPGERWLGPERGTRPLISFDSRSGLEGCFVGNLENKGFVGISAGRWLFSS